MLGGRTRALATGGAPIDDAVVDWARALWDTPFFVAYGTSETSGITTNGKIESGVEVRPPCFVYCVCVCAIGVVAGIPVTVSAITIFDVDAFAAMTTVDSHPAARHNLPPSANPVLLHCCVCLPIPTGQACVGTGDGVHDGGRALPSR